MTVRPAPPKPGRTGQSNLVEAYRLQPVRARPLPAPPRPTASCADLESPRRPEMTFSKEAYQRLLNALAPLKLDPQTLGYYVMGVHVGSFGKPLPEGALGAEITVAEALARMFPSRFGWANCLRKGDEGTSA